MTQAKDIADESEPVVPLFLRPEYAANPICADVLAFWKQAFIAALHDNRCTVDEAVDSADDAADAYVQRAALFVRSRSGLGK